MIGFSDSAFRIELEVVRALIMLAVFVLVWRTGRRHDMATQKGWTSILAGFGLLAFAGLLDITDNFPELNRFVVIGETPTQAFLEKIVGYTGGFIFLFIGLAAWLPVMRDIGKSQQELNERRGRLETLVEKRTADLLSANAALREEVRERRQAEDALRKSRLSLMNAQRIADVGYWERDVASGLLTWSNEIYELFGRSPKEFAPTYDRLIQAIHPDDVERVRNAGLKAIYEHLPYDIEHRIVRPDGSIRHVHSRAEVNYDDRGQPTTMTGVVIDITDRIHSEQALKDSERRFRDFAEVASDWMWETDADLRFTFFSERLYKVLGVSLENALGKTRFDLAKNFTDADALRTHVADMKDRRPFRNFVYSLIDDRGEQRTIRTSGKPVYDADGSFAGYRGTASDITTEVRSQRKLEAAHRQLSEMAHTDTLTGLPNRRSLEGHLRQSIIRARRSGKPGALFYLDLNGFKKINDTHGHEHGDWALKEAAGRIRTPLREVDMVARLGGDEFCIVLEDVGNETSTAHVAEKVIESVCQPCIHLGVELDLGVAVGIAFFSGKDREERIMDVLRRADQAMYRAKKDGGNVFRFSSPDLHHPERTPSTQKA